MQVNGMNRRNFLRLSTGLIVASQIAPSLLWPHRKIFIPAASETFPWGAGNSLFERELIPEISGAWQLYVEEHRRRYIKIRMLLSPRIIGENTSRVNAPTVEDSIFLHPDKVKEIDPFTYTLLYGESV